MKKHHLSIPAKGLRIPKLTQVAKLPCEFVSYRDQKLWYRIHWNAAPDVFPAHLDQERWDVTEMHRFEFPIPLDDAAAGGEFLPEMKAITLMRWIRLHIQYLKDAHDA